MQNNEIFYNIHFFAYFKTRDMIRNKVGSVIFKLRQGGIYFYNIINKTNRNAGWLIINPLTEFWKVLLFLHENPTSIALSVTC